MAGSLLRGVVVKAVEGTLHRGDIFFLVEVERMRGTTVKDVGWIVGVVES